ncbi:polysaccharide deacetylase family protein [Metallococcus carri]|uniref:hypothetical protein n=1 Tax=Metallococcus carri TaxID=1656884 RepID=UPI001409B6DB|nr:hypothetical protein [Metallococcus carri]
MEDLIYQNCFWTCDTRDWTGASAARIVRRAVYGDATTVRADAGGVVLMHMNGKHTGEALPDLIAGLAARGLTFPAL